MTAARSGFVEPLRDNRGQHGPRRVRLGPELFVKHAVRRIYDRAAEKNPAVSLAGEVGQGVYDMIMSGAVSGMAFDLFLAAIPLLALLGWALAAVASANPDELFDTVRQLQVAPEQVQQIILSHTHRYGAGIAPVAFLGSLWIASNALHAPMLVLERAQGSHPRKWWLRRLIAIGSVLLMLSLVVLCATVSVYLLGGPRAIIMAVLKPGQQLPAFRLVALLGAVGIGLCLLAGFYFIAVDRPPPRRVWPGSLCATALGVAASGLLAAYIRDLSNLALYYGSLTAVAVFLSWLWLCSAALLLGATLNASLEARARSPRGRPLGAGEANE